MFVENLLLAIRSKIRNHLTTHPHIGLNSLARYEEWYGNTHRVTRWQSVGTDYLPAERRGSSSRVMSLETDNDENDLEVADGQ